MTTTTREAIVQALFDLVKADAFFPDDSGDEPALLLDEPEPSGWRKLSGAGLDGLEDCAAVQDDEDPEVTAEVLGADADPDLKSYEMNLSPSIAYCVAGVDRGQRRARRDAAAGAIEAIIRADPTLGLTEGEVHARIAGAHREDMVPVPHAKTVAVIFVQLEIDYVAASPAG